MSDKVRIYKEVVTLKLLQISWVINVAKITKTNIINPIINILDEERGLKTTGKFEINRLIREEYIFNNYDSEPKTSKGVAGNQFNGMQVSIADIEFNDIITVLLAETRYFFCKAMGAFYKKHPEISPEELRKISPKIAHTSIKSLVEFTNSLYIPCHIRGKGAYGQGQILSVIAAGGISPADLLVENPLISCLERETCKEIGIKDINTIKPSCSFDLYEEEEVGRVNFSTYSQELSLDYLLLNFRETNNNIFKQGKKSEVEGIALLPFDNILLTSIMNKESLDKIPCYMYDQDNFAELIETNYHEYLKEKNITNIKGVGLFRPITSATAEAIITKKDFMESYQKQSGH